MHAPLVLAPLVAFITAYLMLFWLAGTTAAPKVLDYPDARSLHNTPVPRTGGIGMITGIMLSWLLLDTVPGALWAGATVLATISLADDVKGLSVSLRLMVHSVAVMIFTVSLVYVPYGSVIAFGVGLAMLWMINLYNFMDGSDGLAGGMAVIGFGYYGVGAVLAGHITFAAANFCIAAAAAAFLLFNFYPARIFMGDTGSISLGFLAAAQGILGWLQATWSLWLPLLIFSPFIADATVTLIKRLWRGDRIWQAHCEHYYQRLVRSGFGHRNTALLGYAIMLGAGGSALWSLTRQDIMTQVWLAGIWSGIYFIMMTVFDYYQDSRSRNQQSDCD